MNKVQIPFGGSRDDVFSACDVKKTTRPSGVELINEAVSSKQTKVETGDP